MLHTVKEKEKPYPPDQEDPEVVQPYAAYGPAGHPKVNCTAMYKLFGHPSQLLSSGVSATSIANRCIKPSIYFSCVHAI